MKKKTQQQPQKKKKKRRKKSCIINDWSKEVKIISVFQPLIELLSEYNDKCSRSCSYDLCWTLVCNFVKHVYLAIAKR
jgi:hypothetical protein